ncbi:MAG: hypothetical protein BGO00_07190 [Alphaproteobacteria bacterium 62-8]|nr:MAG: hypothetical protein BGO00_07190 [Alphaproteobacteria bacterium 62-8]
MKENVVEQSQKNPKPRSVALLEDNLALIAKAVAECFETARGIDPRNDEYGHARHSAYQNAVTLLKASARIGQTLAAIQGNKIRHDIRVIRETAPARRRVAANPLPAQELAAPTPAPVSEGSNG